MYLSIVIVNYNTRDALRDCLASLAAVRDEYYEVIVVDNDSTDGSADMVRADFPGVTLIEPGANTGFSIGNNLGITQSGGDVVLLLNPDTVVPPGALTRMVDFLADHPDYTGATCQLRYPDGAIQQTCSRTPTFGYLLLQHTPLRWLLAGRARRAAAQHGYADWDRTTDRDVEVMPGSCTLLRRDKLWLGDRFRLYFPEDDLRRRLDDHRFRFLADVHIIHHEKSATRSWLATRIYFRDLLVYTRQYHGPGGWALLWLLSRPLLIGMGLRQFWRDAQAYREVGR